MLVAAAIILLMIGASLERGFSNENPGESRIDKFWVDKAFASASYDIVLLGDSRLYHGVSPKRLEELLGLKALNFGFGYAGYNEKYISAGVSKFNPDSQNKNFVFLISPHSLTERALKNTQYHEKSSIKFLDRLVMNNFWRQLEDFQSTTIDEILGNKEKPYFSTGVSENGWMPVVTKELRNTHGVSNYKKLFIGNQVQGETIANLMSQVKKLNSSGIKVYGLRPPVDSEVEKLENELSGFKEEEFIKNFEQSGGTWIHIPRTGFDSFDGSHITKESALKLTDIIAKQIKSDLKSKEDY